MKKHVTPCNFWAIHPKTLDEFMDKYYDDSKLRVEKHLDESFISAIKLMEISLQRQQLRENGYCFLDGWLNKVGTRIGFQPRIKLRSAIQRRKLPDTYGPIACRL